MRKLIFSIPLLFIFSFLNGQTAPVKCAIKESYTRAQRNIAIDNLVKRYQENKSNSRVKVFDKIIRIPVVVHVIHNNISGLTGGSSNSNISDQQIISQIKVLNEDYRRKIDTPGFNNHPAGSDMEIEFFLAQTDPEGNSTNGIVRIYNSKKEFDVFDDQLLLSELSYWDSNRYLNVWVTTLSDNYLGYAEFPGAEFDGLDLEDVDERFDGVIIDHKAFGNRIGTAIDGIYTYGRTLTHEIGHWFGLIHTWGDEYCGDDYCNDTPPTERGNLSIRCNPLYSNCNGLRTTNMIENFMDYTADSCMNVFTNDQKARVRAILELSKRRKRLVLNAMNSLPIVESFEVRVLENPTSAPNIKIQALFKDYTNFEVYVYDPRGRTIYYQNFEDSPSRLIQIPINTLNSGINILKVVKDQDVITKKLIRQ